MLIPRSLAKLVSHTDKQSSRYALAGIQIQRESDGNPVAVATDGRRLAAIRWAEPNDGYPADFDDSPVENFCEILDAQHVKSAVAMDSPARKRSSNSRFAETVKQCAMNPRAGLSLSNCGITSRQWGNRPSTVDSVALAALFRLAA